MIIIIITIILDVLLCIIFIPINSKTNNKKAFVFFVIIVIDLAFWIILRLTVPEGVRKYYYVGENNKYCVTVWKKWDESYSSCYALIISGKYKNNFKEPEDNYVKINVVIKKLDCLVGVIVKEDGKLLVVADNVDTICSSDGFLDLYSNNQALNDSIYTYMKKGYKCYKDGFDRITIDIMENYAKDQMGKIQR